MFVCGMCKTSTASGERARRATLKSRERTYKDGEGNVVGSGFEIVKEILVCTRCATGSPFVSKVAVNA
jgi:hypothetical protein